MIIEEKEVWSQLLGEEFKKLNSIETTLNIISKGICGNEKFRLDGHLVGAFGELIASLSYGIELHPGGSNKGFDGEIEIGGIKETVEIRVRREKYKTFRVETNAKYLICLRLDEKELKFTECYNGLASVAKKYQNHKKSELNINKLKEAQKNTDRLKIEPDLGLITVSE
jgi:hypothetical protein